MYWYCFPNCFLLQIITTPTKAYHLWSRPVLKFSPEPESFGSVHAQNSSTFDNDILNEPMPPEMNEQAFEAISEELRMVQVIFGFRKNSTFIKTDFLYHFNSHNLQCSNLFSIRIGFFKDGHVKVPGLEISSSCSFNLLCSV